MLLISSSVIPSSQVHVNSFHFLLECCPNYVILVPCFSFLPVCFHIPFDPLSSCFIFFNLQRFSQCSLFLFDNGVFSISFISLVFSLFVCSISQGSWSHTFGEEATLFYLFPFRFLSGEILDLGTRSSCSGGVL